MKDKKCVVVGVSGGVAVYKALDVISRLRKKDLEVYLSPHHHMLIFH